MARVRSDFTDPNSGGRAPGTARSSAATDVKSIGVSTPAGKTEKAEPMVYLGQTSGQKVLGAGRFTSVPVTDDVVPQSQAYQQVYAWWGTPKYQQLVEHLLSLGLIGEGDASNIQVIAAAWTEMVDISAAMGPSKKVTPWDAAKLMVSQETDGSSTSKGGTYTARSVNLTDAKTARALVDNVMSQALGRAATEEEVKAFVSTLNSAESSNPATTTTVVSDDGTTQSVSTTGGLDAGGKEQLLKERAQALPEYGAHQAGTYYFQALQALAGG